MQGKVHSNSISKTHKCFWPVESKVYPCRFYPYLRVNVNTLALFLVSSPPPSPPQCTTPSSPLRQCEARNSIRFITEPPEISAFSARSWARDSATDPRMYRRCTRPRQIPQPQDNRCQWSMLIEKVEKVRAKAKFRPNEKNLEIILQEEVSCVPRNKYEQLQLLLTVFFFILFMSENSKILICESTSACKKSWKKECFKRM